MDSFGGDIAALAIEAVPETAPVESLRHIQEACGDLVISNDAIDQRLLEGHNELIKGVADRVDRAVNDNPLDDPTSISDKYWSNMDSIYIDNKQQQQPHPSRLDSEWGYVFRKKDTNRRRIVDVGSSSIVMSSCSDLSEALSAISAALSLSSSSSGEGEKQMQMPDYSVDAEMLNLPTVSHSVPSQNNKNQIQAGTSFGEKGKTNEANSVVPAVGMEFSSEQEVYEFYKTYAEETGFRVRKGKVQRLCDGSIRKRYFFCSREGRKQDKQTTFKKKETRTGCTARIECKLENENWKISQFLDVHNHHLECTKVSKIHVVNTEGEAGTSTVNTEGEAGTPTEAIGIKSVEFDKFKMHTPHEKGYVLDLEEVQSLINYFNHLQEVDPSFFSAVQYDDDGKAKAFFWMDGSSKVDYEYFGDVLILNTTFKLHKYGIICSPFIGVNHHQQYVLFGCAFLLDEKIHSIVWLLQTFVKAMDNVQPKTVLTDASLTMADAIKEVFPEAKHRIVLRYIRRILATFSSCYGNSDFQSLFERWFFQCQTEEEFKLGWNCRDNPWLHRLFMSRERWDPSFNKKTFVAGIQDTASIDDIFRSLTREARTPTMFLTEYLKLVVQLREKEYLADCSCKEKQREIVLNNNLFELQAAYIYTYTMFKMFQKELVKCLLLEIKEIVGNETTSEYKLIEEDGNHSIVAFNCLDSAAVCSCSKYESLGILCCHVLKVFSKRNIFIIPPQYILKRWTKFAKVDHMVSNKVANGNVNWLLDNSKQIQFI